MEFVCNSCKKKVETTTKKGEIPDLTCKFCGGILLPNDQFDSSGDNIAFFEHTNPVFKKKEPAGFKPKKIERPTMSILPTAKDTANDFRITAPAIDQDSDDKTVKIDPRSKKKGPAEKPNFEDAETVKKLVRKRKPILSTEKTLGRKQLVIPIVFLCFLVSAAAIYFLSRQNEITDHPERPVDITGLSKLEPTLPVKNQNDRQYERRLLDATRYLEQDNLLEALLAFEEANDAKPDQPEVIMNIGRIFTNSLDAAEMAELEYKRLIYKAKYIQAHLELGKLYEAKGDFYKAVDEYKLYLNELQPGIEEWERMAKKIEMLSRQL